MRRAMFAAVFLLTGGAMAPAALAGPSLNDAYYTRKGGGGEAMLADRTACVNTAQQFGVDRAADFSNPEYGSLTALGAALDEDSMHGGAKQAVRAAVRDACMQHKGWVKLDPSDADLKALKKASSHHPEALDAWIAANPPSLPPPPPPAPGGLVGAQTSAAPPPAPTPATAGLSPMPKPAKPVTDAKPTDPAAPKS